jgi:hypothetical protein
VNYLSSQHPLPVRQQKNTPSSSSSFFFSAQGARGAPATRPQGVCRTWYGKLHPLPCCCHCRQPLHTISFAYKAYSAFIGPLLKLKTFVERERPNNIRVVLKKTAFSAVRILKDENFQRRLSLSQ